MNAQQILSAIGVTKTKEHQNACSRLAAIYKFLCQQKKSIVNVKTETIESMFGCETKREYKRNEWQTTVLNEGTKLPGMKFNIQTKTGNYSFVVPVNNSFHSAVCELLGLAVITPEPLREVKHTFLFPADLITTLNKAVKFVSKDTLRPALQCLLIDIEDDKCKVVATDAHRLYFSKTLEVTSPGGIHTLMIKAADLKTLPKPKKSGYGFNCFEATQTEDDKLLMLDQTFNLYTGSNYPQYRCVIPEYKKGIVFERERLVTKITEVLPQANRTTNEVFFHFNGSIELLAQDIDFGHEATAKMNYLSKDAPDFDISFNGKFMLSALNTFHTENITMLTEGQHDKAALFTDNEDTVLLMPLYFEGREYAGPEVVEKSTGKAVEIFTAYLAFLAERNDKVYITEYADRVSIRFIRRENLATVTGQKIVKIDSVTLGTILQGYTNEKISYTSKK